MKDFVEVRKEVLDYNKEVRDKYQNLNLPEPQDIAYVIDKFKVTHPNIILVEGLESLDVRNWNFGD